MVVLKLQIRALAISELAAVKGAKELSVPTMLLQKLTLARKLMTNIIHNNKFALSVKKGQIAPFGSPSLCLYLFPYLQLFLPYSFMELIKLVRRFDIF